MKKIGPFYVDDKIISNSQTALFAEAYLHRVTRCFIFNEHKYAVYKFTANYETKKGNYKSYSGVYVGSKADIEDYIGDISNDLKRKVEDILYKRNKVDIVVTSSEYLGDITFKHNNKYDFTKFVSCCSSDNGELMFLLKNMNPKNIYIDSPMFNIFKIDYKYTTQRGNEKNDTKYVITHSTESSVEKTEALFDAQISLFNEKHQEKAISNVEILENVLIGRSYVA